MKWESKLIKHKGVVRIAIAFERNAGLIPQIRTFQGSRCK